MLYYYYYYYYVCQGRSSIASFSILTSASCCPSAIAELLVFLYFVLANKYKFKFEKNTVTARSVAWKMWAWKTGREETQRKMMVKEGRKKANGRGEKRKGRRWQSFAPLLITSSNVKRWQLSYSGCSFKVFLSTGAATHCTDESKLLHIKFHHHIFTNLGTLTSCTSVSLAWFLWNLPNM